MTAALLLFALGGAFETAAATTAPAGVGTGMGSGMGVPNYGAVA